MGKNFITKDTARKDCFAYCRVKDDCMALTELVCAFQWCRFYKNKEDYNRQQKYRRIKKVSNE